MVSLPEKDQNGPDKRQTQNQASIICVLNTFYDPHTDIKSKADKRQKNKIGVQAVGIDGFPGKDMEGDFEEIHNEEEPGNSTDKLIFWEFEYQKVDVRESSSQIAEHGRKAGYQAH